MPHAPSCRTGGPTRGATAERRDLPLLVLLVAAALAAPAPARAAGNQFATILIHTLSPTSKNSCVRAENLPAHCSDFEDGVHNLALYPTTYFAYVLVANGSPETGVSGIQFGIEYEGGANGATDGAGIDIYGWTACSTLELVTPPGGGINAWPNPNSGMLLVWNAPENCQMSGNEELGVVATAGYFYLGAMSTAELRLEPRQVDNAARVFDCAGQEDTFLPCFLDYYMQLGRIGFNMPGYNPTCTLHCPDPVVPATWSGIKTLLR